MLFFVPVFVAVAASVAVASDVTVARWVTRILFVVAAANMLIVVSCPAASPSLSFPHKVSHHVLKILGRNAIQAAVVLLSARCLS